MLFLSSQITSRLDRAADNQYAHLQNIFSQTSGTM